MKTTTSEGLLLAQRFLWFITHTVESIEAP